MREQTVVGSLLVFFTLPAEPRRRRAWLRACAQAAGPICPVMYCPAP